MAEAALHTELQQHREATFRAPKSARALSAKDPTELCFSGYTASSLKREARSSMVQRRQTMLKPNTSLGMGSQRLSPLSLVCYLLATHGSLLHASEWKYQAFGVPNALLSPGDWSCLLHGVECGMWISSWRTTKVNRKTYIQFKKQPNILVVCMLWFHIIMKKLKIISQLKPEKNKQDTKVHSGSMLR